MRLSVVNDWYDGKSAVFTNKDGFLNKSEMYAYLRSVYRIIFRLNPETKIKVGGATVEELAECATLQDFPPDHPWQGTKADQYRQVGNAVPPTLARVVIESIMRAAL